jgi:hypothetical protein
MRVRICNAKDPANASLIIEADDEWEQFVLLTITRDSPRIEEGPHLCSPTLAGKFPGVGTVQIRRAYKGPAT